MIFTPSQCTLTMITVLIAILLGMVPSTKPLKADYVLRGATLYDGTGKPGQIADLAIQGDRIVAIGKNLVVEGPTRVIPAAGYFIAPGFIDLHTHSDDDIILPKTQSNLNYLTQGVTTIVTGNCGFGPVNVQAYLEKIAKQKAGTNVCHLIPHNSLRSYVMGNVNRPPTPAEMKRQLELMNEGMRDGAWGFSTGLFYTPGAYASQDELVALAEVAGKYGGIYASHIRDEGESLLPALDEALAIGRRARLPVHISHFKAAGRAYWGQAPTAIARVAQARQNGQRVTADQYPYSASSTSLQATVIPPRFREGKQEEMVARFNDPQLGRAMCQAVAERIRQSDDGRDIRIARYAPRPAWQGKNLWLIASEAGRNPLEIVIEIEKNGGAQIVHFSMNDEDVRLIMKQSFMATASDGSTRVPDDTMPHPRHYGTFPRKIGHYALGEGWLPVEQAIRSATGLPADILGLPRRGYLRTDYYADIVVFNPRTFRDTAQYDKPHQYSTGVEYLFVNGVLVIESGRYTDQLAGKSLRHEPIK